MHSGCNDHYRRESVNRSQTDIKCKTCDIWTWKKYFMTHPPPILIHFSHCFISASKSSDCCLSHLRTSISTSSLSGKVCHVSRPSYEQLYTTNTSNRKQKIFLMNILCTESFCPQKRTNNAAPKARSPFWLLKPASEHAHARLLPRLSHKAYYVQNSCFTSILITLSNYLH
jgi:hypothetical protein